MFVAEQESLTKTMALLVNRVYRDYYHYYNAIVKELAKYEVSQPVVEKQHLVYKDTEPNAEFQAEDIALVFDNIVVLLNSISLKYNENEMVIQQYKTRSTTGIFIGNLINTLEYDNSVLDDHAKLFFKSVEFTIRTQSAYFAKLLKRVQSAVEDIDGEVSFHESSWDNSSLSVSDQLVQTTDDGNPRLSQWTGTKEDNGAKEEEEPCVVGMTIDEIYKNNA
jgi:transcription termination factor NusB